MKKMLSFMFVFFLFFSTEIYAENYEVNMNKAQIVKLNATGLALLTFPQKVVNVNMLPSKDSNLNVKFANHYSIIFSKKNSYKNVNSCTVFVSIQGQRKPLVFMIE